MAVYLGLDCGGSRTRARAVDEAGSVVFEGEGGPANLASVDWGVVEASLREALRGVPSVDAVCGCFAGLLASGDAAKAKGLLEHVTAGRGGARPAVEARPDFHAAWEVAREECDILAIAGTGSLVCSESASRVVKSGGGGVLLGDEGSAAAVGRAALHGQIVTALSLPATDAFWAQVDKVFRSREPDEVLAALYRSGSPAKMLADLAGVVANDAAAEEDYAVFAVAGVVNAIQSEIEAHALRYQKEKLGALRIGLTGGLWKIHPVFFEWLQPFAQEARVRSTKRVIEVEPVEGACRLARRLLK